MTDVAASKLRAHIGVFTVLHTWGQTLVFHPHVHCVVPGGGFSFDGRRWVHIPTGTNKRLTAFDGERVTFQYRDYHDGNARKSMDLQAVEFLRRFLLHVVPARFTRIRYYGFLANRDRSANIEKARALIGSTRQITPRAPAPDPRLCFQCHQGTMRTRATIDPQRPRTWFDSS